MPLSLHDGEVLHLTESSLVACSSSLFPPPAATSRREDELPCLRLMGPGELVLRSPGELHALVVRPGQSGFFDEGCVLAWTSSVTIARDAGSGDDADGHLVCSGHGHVLLSVASR